MSYSTAADFVSSLSPRLRSQLSAESGTAQDTTIVTECLAKASAELDSRIGSRYTTPVTAAIPAGWLAQKEEIGAVWFLFMYRGIGDREDAAAAAKAAWNDCLTWAEKVGKGELDLPGAARRTDVTSTSAIVTAAWTSNDVVFSADDVGSF